MSQPHLTIFLDFFFEIFLSVMNQRYSNQKLRSGMASVYPRASDGEEALPGPAARPLPQPARTGPEPQSRAETPSRQGLDFRNGLQGLFRFQHSPILLRPERRAQERPSVAD